MNLKTKKSFNDFEVRAIPVNTLREKLYEKYIRAYQLAHFDYSLSELTFLIDSP